MKDRLITLAMGLAALYAVLALFVFDRPPDIRPISFPTTADTGAQGLVALKRWLSEAGIATHSLRLRYDATGALPAGSGHLLIASSPQRWPVRSKEARALRDWVSRGNTVVMLVARYDAPEWSRELGYQDELPRAFGLDFDRVELAEDEASADSAGSTWRTLATTPIVAGRSRRLAVLMSAPEEAWALSSTNDAPALVLAQVAPQGWPAIWRFPQSRGTVIVSAYADLFGHTALGREDNARFMAELVQAHVAPHGVILFDDMHLGLSELYDPRAFVADPRVRATAAFLVALWFLYLVGRGARLGPLARGQRLPRAVDFVHAVGGLFARRLTRQAALAALIRNFFNDVRARHALPRNGAPVWDVLARDARIAPERLAQLRALAQKSQPRPRDLVAAANLIHQLRSRHYD